MGFMASSVVIEGLVVYLPHALNRTRLEVILLVITVYIETTV